MNTKFKMFSNKALFNQAEWVPPMTRVENDYVYIGCEVEADLGMYAVNSIQCYLDLALFYVSYIETNIKHQINYEYRI